MQFSSDQFSGRSFSSIRLKYSRLLLVSILYWGTLIFCPSQIVQAAELQPKSESKPQIFRLKLRELANVVEWIRVEVDNNQIKAQRSTVTPSGLSRALSATGLVPFSIDHTWYDHPTSRITFLPDDCSEQNKASKLASNCAILGDGQISLPTGTSIHQGQLTVEYQDNNFLYSVSFRVPEEKHP